LFIFIRCIDVVVAADFRYAARSCIQVCLLLKAAEKKHKKHDDNVVICRYYSGVGWAEALESAHFLSPYSDCYW
jgi:hypothetical protein